MDIEIKTWIYDIAKASKEIDDFLIEVPDFKAYEKDVKQSELLKGTWKLLVKQ